MHFLEIMKQLNIDTKKELHLIYPIQEFVLEKEADNPWEFRIKPDGNKCWVNKNHMTVCFTYPFINGLRLKIDEYKRDFNIEKGENQKKKINIIDFILVDRASGLAVMDENKTKTYRVNFLFKCSFTNWSLLDYGRLLQFLPKF